MLEQCPRHGGAFDCTPFCELCEGKQEYNPQQLITCQVPDCTEQLTKVIYNEELGFCVECQHAWIDGELDPYTLERIIPECKFAHEWIGSPLYCSACGVDKGNERVESAN